MCVNKRLQSIEDNIHEAKAELAALEDIGIHYGQVTRQLQEEGVQKFANSFHMLFQGIENSRRLSRRKELRMIEHWVIPVLLLEPCSLESY